jgi:putative two-component system response regulator
MDNEEFLEELDELEDIESLSKEDDSNSFLTDSKKFSSDVNPFKHCIFPVFFIDKKLKILYANQASERLFQDFKNMSGQYLTDLFGKFFNLDDIRLIRETALKGTNGYCWKGEVRVKSREMATTQLKVFLFPFDITVKDPVEFIVMFDDVTEENRSLLRSVFMSLLGASKLKDNDTGQHITRVNYYSKRLAK